MKKQNFRNYRLFHIYSSDIFVIIIEEFNEKMKIYFGKECKKWRRQRK